MDVGKQVTVNAWRCGSERTVPLMWSWMESSLAESEAWRNTHSLRRCVADEARCLCSVRRVLWRFLLSRHDIRHSHLSYEAKVCTFTSFKSEIQHSVKTNVTSLYSESQRSKHPERHSCSYKTFWVNSAIVSVITWQLCNFWHYSDCWNVSHKRNSLNVLWQFCVTTSKCLKAFKKHIISGVKLSLVIRYWKLFHRHYWYERDWESKRTIPE